MDFVNKLVFVPGKPLQTYPQILDKAGEACQGQTLAYCENP